MPPWISYVNFYTIITILGFNFTWGEVSIITSPRDQRIRAGKNVRFQCEADGNSFTDTGPPAIEWSKDYEDLQKSISNQKGRYKINKASNSLVIKNVSVEDTGLYSCLARLGKNIDTKSAQLIVEDVPDPPVNVELTECSGRIAQIRWKLISENYSPVLRFIIEFSTSFETDKWYSERTLESSKARTVRIAVSPWGNYTFRVIAENAVGQSLPSLPTKEVCRTPPDVPRHSPQNVCTLNKKPHELVIAWQSMSKLEQNGPDFHYKVKWRREDHKDAPLVERTVEGHVNQITIENQPIYETYEITVHAANRIGEAVLSKTTTGNSSEDRPEEIVRNFKLDPDKPVKNTTADFIWDHVNDAPWIMKGFFRGYKIEFWKTKEGIMKSKREYSIIVREPSDCWRYGKVYFGRQKRHQNAGATESGHLYNLWPYTNITAHIRVLNVNYAGEPSAKVTFTTSEGVPGAVSRFSISKKDATKFELEWGKPTSPNGILTGYTLGYRVIDPGVHSMEEISINDPQMTHTSLTNLSPGSKYEILLWAKTKVGVGERVQLIENTLPPGPPVAPNFTWENVSNLKGAIKVSWFPSAPGNEGTSFVLEYRKYGQREWSRRKPESSSDRSIIVKSLQPTVAYEMRVIAYSGNTVESPETSSPVQMVRIGMKRDLEQPTFVLEFSKWKSKNIVYVYLKSYDKATVANFYVQYKPTGVNTGWLTLSDTPATKWAMMQGLKKGISYQIRVVTNSPLGIATSLEMEFIPGQDAAASSSSANIQALNAASCSRNTTRLILLSIILIILQIQRGYL